MEKYDVRREFKHLYAPGAKDFVEVEVPTFGYLAVEGSGDPNTSAAYSQAIEALYPVAYALKFAGKAQGRDCVVGPLEALWWAQDISTFLTRDKDAWSWRAMISTPPWTDDAAVRDAVAATAAKNDLPGLELLRFEQLTEGRCLQILHVGPYDDEGPTLTRLHEEVIPERGLRFNGHHHEIYLSDPRRTAPEKLRTILRQPVAPA
ncbi:GyrI-like domain-containing protein [Tessaracoccus terricola]